MIGIAICWAPAGKQRIFLIIAVVEDAGAVSRAVVGGCQETLRVGIGRVCIVVMTPRRH